MGSIHDVVGGAACIHRASAVGARRCPHRLLRGVVGCDRPGVNRDETGAGPAFFPYAGLVRRARRIADMSQREMAKEVGISQATINRIERNALVPSLRVLFRIFDVAGLSLVVVESTGEVVLPMVDWTDALDGAERRYPSHLDTIIDPQLGEWWGDRYGLVRPPETFYRDRSLRDEQRRRSQWEVRVKKYRHVPPPPLPRDYWKPRVG